MTANRQKIIIISLIIILALAIGYIGYNFYQKQRAALYYSGAQAGYQEAIVQIMQKAATCEQIPLYAGNATINLIAVECLQQAQASSSQTTIK